jgi:Mlc titration factor MtfA (ptsG expression regulator)
MFAWVRRRRRNAIRRRPLPPEWRAFIEKNVPYVARLSPEDRAELVAHVQVFLAEKHFEGCGGLQITDEIRVTIAAQACALWRSMYVAWARVLGHDFDQLVRDTEQHHRTLIDQYGATNPAEFFAVVTETFFEKPRQLRAKHPELYLQLRQFYRQDPAELGTR